MTPLRPEAAEYFKKSMENIELKHVSKSFGEKEVLKDVSLTFPAGKVTALMGASGTGKTTMLSLILKLIRPDAGTITGIPEKKAAVFQEDRLFEDFSVLSNLTAATGKEEEAIKKGLAALGLSEAAFEKAGILSGGMKRRAAILRALLSDYDLLVLDEPFKGLDEALREETARYVLSENAGRTVIMVTHDPAEAELMGAEVIHLS